MKYRNKPNTTNKPEKSKYVIYISPVELVKYPNFNFFISEDKAIRNLVKDSREIGEIVVASYRGIKQWNY